MQPMSRRQRVLLACAPIFASAALFVERAHPFMRWPAADDAVSAILGLALGVSVVALFTRGRRC